jgi:hypothetical protein
LLCSNGRQRIGDAVPGREPSDVRHGQRLRWQLPHADPVDADPDAGLVRQVPPRRAQAGRVRQCSGTDQGQGGRAAHGAMLPAAEGTRRPRGRRVPLHRHQGRGPRNQAQPTGRPQPHPQPLRQESAHRIQVPLSYKPRGACRRARSSACHSSQCCLLIMCYVRTCLLASSATSACMSTCIRTNTRSSYVCRAGRFDEQLSLLGVSFM